MNQLFLTDLLVLIPMLAGIVLLIIEIFLPGFGVSGISGLVLEGIAIYFTATRHGASSALILTAIVLGITILAIFFSFRSATKGRLSKTALILNETEQTVSESLPGLNPGDEGVAVTPLRPAGTAVFGERRLDVMTEGDFVQKDQKVRILRIDGTRITVRSF